MPQQVETVNAGAAPESAGTRPAVSAEFAVSSAVILTLLGSQMIYLQPPVVEAMVSHAHFSDTAASGIATSEMVGLTMATFLAIPCMRMWSWRRLALCGVVIVLLGNTASCFFSSSGVLLTARVSCGVGCGLLYSIGSAALSMTAYPGRAFGWSVGVASIYGGSGAYLIPHLVEVVGLQSVFAVLALMTLTGFYSLRHLPNGAVATASHGTDSGRVLMDEALSVAASMLFFLSFGVIWAHLFLIGTTAGIPESRVATAFAISTLFSALGGFSVAAVSRRFSSRVLVSIGLAASAVPLIILGHRANVVVYALAVSTFQFGTSFAMPMLFEQIAAVDTAGRLVALAVGLQMTAFSIGPSLAAYLSSDGRYALGQAVAFSLLVSCLACAQLSMYRTVRGPCDIRM